MRLESALYTSSSGMNAHGQAIAAIGDNISNVNTTGFKGQRTEFSSLVADGLQGGSTSTVSGGGNGVKVSSIRSIHQAGAIEVTGRDLDASIDGEGFFVVGTTEQQSYTRAGNFAIDADGNLSMPTGQTVLGFDIVNGQVENVLGTINLRDFSANGTPTTAIGIAGNIDSNSILTTVPAAPATFKELNNVASFLASTDAVDSLGNTHSISLAFFKTAASTYTVQAYIDGGDVGGTVGTPTLLGQSTLAFDGTGVIPEASKAAAQMTLTPAYGGGAAPGNIALDLSSFTQYASLSSLGSITNNGLQPGALRGYEIEDGGNVIALLDNGTRLPIASLALATFNNVDGLKKSGDNLFKASDTTGDPDIGVPGTGARGTLRGTSLERSTVDLGTEFPTLITIQRGYQANSKILGTVDQMIDQALSLLR